mgnify:CR=1 FL=1
MGQVLAPYEPEAASVEAIAIARIVRAVSDWDFGSDVDCAKEEPGRLFVEGVGRDPMGATRDQAGEVPIYEFVYLAVAEELCDGDAGAEFVVKVAQCTVYEALELLYAVARGPARPGLRVQDLDSGETGTTVLTEYGTICVHVDGGGSIVGPVDSDNSYTWFGMTAPGCEVA